MRIKIEIENRIGGTQYETAVVVQPSEVTKIYSHNGHNGAIIEVQGYPHPLQTTVTVDELTKCLNNAEMDSSIYH